MWNTNKIHFFKFKKKSGFLLQEKTKTYWFGIREGFKWRKTFDVEAKNTFKSFQDIFEKQQKLNKNQLMRNYYILL